MNEKGTKRGFQSLAPKAWTKKPGCQGPFERLAAWESFESQWLLIPEGR